jgi:hypothetical protein
MLTFENNMIKIKGNSEKECAKMNLGRIVD